MAIAAGDVGQSDADVGGQPESGLVADGDLLDLEPGGRRNHGIDDRGHGIYPTEKQASNGLGSEGGADGGGSSASEVFAGVEERAGLSGGVSPIAGGRT